MCRHLRREHVPPVPEGAYIIEGDEETIYGLENRRWRYRRGILVKYLVFGPKAPRRSAPVLEIYTRPD